MKFQRLPGASHEVGACGLVAHSRCKPAPEFRSPAPHRAQVWPRTCVSPAWGRGRRVPSSRLPISAKRAGCSPGRSLISMRWTPAQHSAFHSRALQQRQVGSRLAWSAEQTLSQECKNKSNKSFVKKKKNPKPSDLHNREHAHMHAHTHTINVHRCYKLQYFLHSLPG